MFNASDGPNNLNSFTKMRTPHTYAIIFCVVLFSWILTFMVPAGRFSTHDVQYKDAKGNTKTRTVLMPETFRYSYKLDAEKLSAELARLVENPDAAGPFGGKSLGEPAMEPSPGAILGAVNMALGNAGAVRTMPADLETVFFALHPDCAGGDEKCR